MKIIHGPILPYVYENRNINTYTVISHTTELIEGPLTR